MLKDSTVELTGNDRYEGFAVDLIEALAPILGINYEIIIQDDGNFGVYDNETQTWDGMIGKIISGVSWIHKALRKWLIYYFSPIFRLRI